MMSLPGNRTQQDPEPRDPGSTAGGEWLPIWSAVCPCPEAGDSGGFTGRVCGIAVDAGSGPPEVASGPLPEGTGR